MCLYEYYQRSGLVMLAMMMMMAMQTAHKYTLNI
jgi:hypothetical protein